MQSIERMQRVPAVVVFDLTTEVGTVVISNLTAAGSASGVSGRQRSVYSSGCY